MLDLDEAMTLLKNSPRKTRTGPIGSSGFESEFKEYEKILEICKSRKNSVRELYLIDAKWYKSWNEYIAGDREDPPPEIDQRWLL